MTFFTLVLIAVIGLGLQLQMAYGQQFPIPPPNGSTLAPLSPLDSNVTIGGKSYESPQALMESVIKQAQEPTTLDKMIEECDILKTEPSTEENLECQERVMNESKETSKK